MELSNKYWWLSVIRGLILTALAFFVFRHPVNALVALAIYLGISLLITGIFESIGAFAVKKISTKWGWLLVGGILDLLFGLIFLTNPVVTAFTIPFILGIWFIVRGVMVFVNSFSAKKEGMSNWVWSLISGILILLFGYFISFNILFGMLTITFWMGTGLLIVGLYNIFEGFSLKPKK